MDVAYIYLHSQKSLHNSSAYFKRDHQQHTLYTCLKQCGISSIRVVQRAIFDKTINHNGIGYYFVTDEFQPLLRWWQEPVSAIEILAELKPQIIHVYGLDLPLFFRWLRRRVGEETIIMGQHMGEDIWANRNLWLQQFGLRPVDGFIFHHKDEERLWTRASVILSKQPIFEIARSPGKVDIKANQLKTIYNEMLTRKT
jgi:hypothetical protein